MSVIKSLGWIIIIMQGIQERERERESSGASSEEDEEKGMLEGDGEKGERVLFSTDDELVMFVFLLSLSRIQQDFCLERRIE
ncbi:hypothetical protein TNIN_398381 [Trichonephila inaurata madagascariensis]|uniref:Uncharacterized protein n=1 Tax=Trichonephila inaurata madagascariensis TaxID=2747483 RepID=A0A8X6X939_9ARAC|nr:hypothetical protein TNIN_398381 [Trichonephila inaurata madagascariensis]